jgi:hypothetical protein
MTFDDELGTWLVSWVDSKTFTTDGGSATWKWARN